MAKNSTANLALIHLLLELDRRKYAGIVRLEHGRAKRQLVVRSGRLAFAESNVAEEHLARILLKMEAISRRDLPRIASLMKSGKSSDEAVALATGIEEETLREGVRRQAEAILSALLTLPAAEVKLYKAADLLRRHVDLELQLPPALVLASRRAVAEGRVPRRLRVLSGMVSRDPDAENRLALPLDRSEAYIYAQAKTPLSVEDFGVPEGSPQELLPRLVLLGLLKLDSPSGTPSEADPSGAGVTVGEIEEMLRRFEVANHYEILSVDPAADGEQIKRAYHEMARRYHPDRFQSAECEPDFRLRVDKLFTYITGSYSVLSDPARRSGYDETRLKAEGGLESTLKARAAADLEKEKMAETLYRSGRLALADKDFEKAAARLKECVWLRPDVAKYQHYLGVAQTEVPSQRKEAERHLLKALEQDRTAIDVHFALARLYLRVDLPKRAEAQVREALRWDGDNPKAHRMLEEIRRWKSRVAP